MMSKTCTDIEQSKKLIELGIDPDTADMGYLWWMDTETKKEGIDEIPTVLNGLPLEKTDIPAWSLSALLNLLPLSTTLDHEINGWYCNINYDIVNIKEGHKDYTIICDNPIDAAFEMICWIRKNNKI